MADILIRGMEMPKSGRILCINIFPDGKVTRQLDLSCEQIATAVPLPKEHGRLGDLDALSKEFEHLISLNWNQKAAPYSWAYAYSEAQAAVDDSPTIVPAEGGGEDG